MSLSFVRPSLVLGQHFVDDDFLETFPRRARRMLLTSPYSRNWRSLASKRDKGSTLSLDRNKFQVSLDVQQFTPEEITVKATENTVIVEGKHEEKEDEHGMIYRHFVRKYTLPEGHDINGVESRLSSDGVLTITAPRSEDKVDVREIPITITGEPTKPSIEVGADEGQSCHKAADRSDAKKKKKQAKK